MIQVKWHGIVLSRSVFTSIFVTLVMSATIFPVYSASTSIPNNAHTKSYGSGWECNLGFREKEDLCLPVVVPKNAHPTN